MRCKLAIRCFALTWFLGIGVFQLAAQKVEFTLRFNEDNQRYEVYGKADFADEQFFVGGGSQLSIILPTDLVDYPLTIQSMNGGPWTDNSQIYAPSIDTGNDYHGIATNGSRMNFQPNEETLLFTFELPEKTDQKKVRLFDNEKDPHSNRTGMGGADFCNFFACALTVQNFYGGVYTDNITPVIPLTTSLEETLTLDFDLFQNKPNPFNGTTTIGFLLPQASPVQLTLRDMTGRVIQTLDIDGIGGQNTVQLPATNLPKGLIHYQLDTPFGSKNKKMILLE